MFDSFDEISLEISIRFVLRMREQATRCFSTSVRVSHIMGFSVDCWLASCFIVWMRFVLVRVYRTYF